MFWNRNFTQASTASKLIICQNRAVFFQSSLRMRMSNSVEESNSISNQYYPFLISTFYMNIITKVYILSILGGVFTLGESGGHPIVYRLVAGVGLLEDRHKNNSRKKVNHNSQSHDIQGVSPGLIEAISGSKVAKSVGGVDIHYCQPKSGDSECAGEEDHGGIEELFPQLFFGDLLIELYHLVQLQPCYEKDDDREHCHHKIQQVFCSVISILLIAMSIKQQECTGNETYPAKAYIPKNKYFMFGLLKYVMQHPSSLILLFACSMYVLTEFQQCSPTKVMRQLRQLMQNNSTILQPIDAFREIWPSSSELKSQVCRNVPKEQEISVTRTSRNTLQRMFMRNLLFRLSYSSGSASCCLNRRQLCMLRPRNITVMTQLHSSPPKSQSPWQSRKSLLQALLSIAANSLITINSDSHTTTIKNDTSLRGKSAFGWQNNGNGFYWPGRNI